MVADFGTVTRMHSLQDADEARDAARLDKILLQIHISSFSAPATEHFCCKKEGLL
jgi:hypothetical protein